MAARAREHGIYSDSGCTGRHNAITDVRGVRVGHTTISEPPAVHSGVTAIRFGDVNPNAPLPAGLSVGNGYGKLIGATQLAELGQIEAPILLTSTLSAFRAADAMVSWMLLREDCAAVRTFNPVVGECNDGALSDIRSRPVRAEHVHNALQDAETGPVAEGSTGAGTGMIALGFKAGIGTSSRIVELHGESVTVGVLVLANFGGVLRAAGQQVSVPTEPGGDRHHGIGAAGDASDKHGPQDDGSCMIVLATDAPLDARQLRRLANRAVFALARVGAAYAHGSGDYAIAVSTVVGADRVRDAALDALFTAALDGTEEAVLNALVAAQPVTGADGRTAPALSQHLPLP